MILRTGLALILSTAALAAHATDAFLLVDGHIGLTREPCVAVDDQGDTVFAWASEVPGGAQPLNCIRLRRFDPKGQEIGKELRIDALPGDLARNPDVSFQPGSSRFVVVWEGGSEGEKLRRRIWARVFDGDGKPVGTEIRVDQIRLRHDYWGLPREYFGGPAVSVAPSGDFVVVWRSDGRTSCDRFNISARRFSASGEPLADEIIVNRDRRWSQINPDVGHDGAGNFVIVWRDGRWIGTDSEVSVVRGRVFDKDGVGQGFEFDLSPEDRLAAGAPDLAVTPGGSFFCAWADRSRGFRPLTLLVGSYYPEGWTIGAPIVIESGAFEPTDPKIALTGRGEFMVIWSDIAGDRFKSSVVVGQRFAFDGTPIENAEVVSPATCRGISSPSVAASISGVGALAWEVGHPTDIRGCRFAAAGPATTLPTPGAGPSLPIRIAAWRKELLEQRTDPADRISAADRIACMRSEASWVMAGLVKCLNEDGNIDVRAACIRAVGAVAENPQEALGPLTLAFQDREQSNLVRAAAADVIGSFGDEARAAAPVLLEELGEALPSRCSEMAAKALGRIGDLSGIEMTTEVLKSNWLIFWRGYVTGLAELIEHEQAYSALSKAKERCVKRSTGRLTWRGENPD